MVRRMNRIRRTIVTRAVAVDASLSGIRSDSDLLSDAPPSTQAVDALQLHHISHQIANPGPSRRRQILGRLFDLSTKDT